MVDLNEMAGDMKRSDTSLMNMMQNYKVSVRYYGKSWVASTEDHTGMGNSLRSALVSLDQSMKGGSRDN